MAGGAGLLGLALKLGARVFRGSEEDNIKLLGKWGMDKNSLIENGCIRVISSMASAS